MPIRLRLAGVFALGTAVVIVVASVVFVHLLAAGLRSSLDANLRARADAVVPLLDGVAAAANAGHPVATLRGQGEGITQVFDTSGRLVASSSGAGDVPLLSQPDLARAHQAIVSKTTVLGGTTAQGTATQGTATQGTATQGTANATISTHGGERFQLIAYPVARPGGTWVVMVGGSLEGTDAAVHRVTNAALLGGPPAVLIAALGAWLLASAALRPVERMRRQVAEISQGERDTEIEVPVTRDEIAALARTMNDLLGRLQEALERERGFVADAGHELRTPLAILRAELELASRPGRTRAELASAVGAAAEETNRLARLADSLLLLARSDSRQTLRLQPTNLHDVLETAVDRARAAAQANDVELSLDAAQRLDADVDPDRIRQAVDNLLDNAIRHAAPSTVVTVHAGQQSGNVVIEVIDHGSGFPPEFLPHAFERFSRADSARSRSGGGTGLGLAIVQSIARAHGGRAVATNSPGGGASVRIELPAAHLAMSG
jgi:heavy metal sensor kinase